jgi:hypothetical protein
MAELIDRWLRCTRCGGHFALLRRNVQPLEPVDMRDVSHLDGRPIYLDDPMVCDSCGQCDQFVLMLPRQPEVRE